MRKINQRGEILLYPVKVKTNRAIESLKMTSVFVVVFGISFLAVFLILFLMTGSVETNFILSMIGLLLFVTLFGFFKNYYFNIPAGFVFTSNFSIRGMQTDRPLNYLVITSMGLYGIFKSPFRNIISFHRPKDEIITLNFNKKPYWFYRFFHSTSIKLKFSFCQDVDILEKELLNRGVKKEL